VCQQWNDLPGEIVDAGSVNGFKRGVDKILRGAIGDSFWSSLDLFPPLRAVEESNFSFAVLGMLGTLGIPEQRGP